MIVWVDAQLSPRVARWLSERFGVEAIPIRDLGLREAADQQIFEAAKAAGAIVITKDLDFIEMVERLGPPPQIIWITCGNTSNQKLRELLGDLFQDAMRMLYTGEPLVEIG